MAGSDEIALLPYVLNEFSFKNSPTMVLWMSRRFPVQKWAMEKIWLDLNWVCIGPIFGECLSGASAV